MHHGVTRKESVRVMILILFGYSLVLQAARCRWSFCTYQLNHCRKKILAYLHSTRESGTTDCCSKLGHMPMLLKAQTFSALCCRALSTGTSVHIPEIRKSPLIKADFQLLKLQRCTRGEKRETFVHKRGRAKGVCPLSFKYCEQGAAQLQGI